VPEPYPPRTLGGRESRLLSSLSAAGQKVFTIESARAMLSETDANVRKLLHRLHRKRWARRLERGKYLILPLAAGPEGQWAEHEYLIVATLVNPNTLASAAPLHYYGYSERPPNPIFIAATRRKRHITIDQLTCRVVTLKPHKFFSYEPISLLGSTVHMAEREKAVADSLDHPELARGVLEAARGLWFSRQELDLEKLVAYTLRLRNQVAARRLGFWLELPALGDDWVLSRLEGGKGPRLCSSGAVRYGRWAAQCTLAVDRQRAGAAAVGVAGALR
jgi:predicted transcriptional regulator of viral defense system